MNHRNANHPLDCLRGALVAAGIALSLIVAASPAKAGDWKFTATPYVWATDLAVKADVNGRQVVNETVSIGDLVKQLDTIFQGRFDAQYRTIGLSADVFDVTMSDQVDGVALPQGMGTGSFTPDIRMTIFDLAATYTPVMRRRSISALGGMRLVYERADVDANLNLSAGPSVAQNYNAHDTLVDGLIGARFVQPLSPRWGVQGQVDVSTGGTNYTWSAAPSVFYVFDAARHYALSAGYRHMHIDFKDSDGFDADMALSGALVGFRWSF